MQEQEQESVCFIRGSEGRPERRQGSPGWSRGNILELQDGKGWPEGGLSSVLSSVAIAPPRMPTLTPSPPLLFSRNNLRTLA